MLEFIELPLKVSQNLRIPHTFKAMRSIYDKWNGKARNTIFTGLCKDVFNYVQNHKDTVAEQTNL